MAIDAVREEQAMRRMADALMDRYRDTHSVDQVQAVIGDVRDRFTGRPVREFVPILIERIVRHELDGPDETPTSTTATATAQDDTVRIATGATRFASVVADRRRLVLAGGAATAVVVVAVAFGLSNSDPAPVAAGASTAQTVVVRGVVGSEKIAYFEDPEVVRALATHGLRVEVDAAGSRQIATGVDLDQYDFAFPSSAPAAERITRGRGVTAEYTPFSSPMAIATFRPIADLLTSVGVVRPGPVPAFDMARYLELVRSNTEWAALPGNTAYPVRKNILVSTTDPRTSNSAAMYLSIAAFVANDNAVVQGGAAEQTVLPTLSKLFTGQGYTESTSDAPWREYLNSGMGATPLVMIYEAQFIEAAATGQLRPDMVLTYPSPTVLSRHTLIALRENGDRLGRLLTEDPVLRELAARHGFRTGDADGFARATANVPVAPQVIDVVATPTYDTLERLLDGVARVYN